MPEITKSGAKLWKITEIDKSSVDNLSFIRRIYTGITIMGMSEWNSSLWASDGLNRRAKMFFFLLGTAMRSTGCRCWIALKSSTIELSDRSATVNVNLG